MWGEGRAGAGLGWAEARFLMSSFWFLVFWFLVFDFWFQFSDFWFLVLVSVVSGFWFQFSDASSLIYLFIFHISKNYPTSGIWLLNSNFSSENQGSIPLMFSILTPKIHKQIWPPSLLFLFLGITRDSPATQSIQTHTQTEGLITICFYITSRGKCTWKC